MSNTDNSKFLYDAYNAYYENGIKAIEKKNYSLAAKNLFNASQTLLKLAKKSTNSLKESRFKRADEIYKIALEYEEKAKKITENNHSKDYSSKVLNDEDRPTSFLPISDTGVSMDDVAGLEEAKEEIKQKIIEPTRHPDIFEKYQKSKGGGILLYGAPGTGKTMLAQAIAHEIDAKFFTVKCSDILSKWFGEAEKNIKNLFQEAKKHLTSIIFFDEFEAIASKRDTNSSVMKRVVPELLSQIQGFEKSDNNLVVIAATNRPWDIDSAFLRPGRFDRSIYVPLPDEKAREAIIKNKLKNVPCDDQLSISDIVMKTVGFNGADVANFCEKLKDLAITRELNTGNETCIMQEDIAEARKMVSSSVFAEDIERCMRYRREHSN